MSRHAFLFLMIIAVAGCGRDKPADSNRIDDPLVQPLEPDQVGQSFPPGQKPVPPLKLGKPQAPTSKLDGKDLNELDAEDLLDEANGAMADEDYSKAAIYQHWYVQKSKTGQYNLACFLARTGKADEAFYWLQMAAIEEGVDTSHAMRDEDLTSLRRDSRWASVRNYLSACNRYFETATDLAHLTYALPAKYKLGTPIPVVLWLHGMGSRPEDFGTAFGQQFADKMNVAIIGVSGTRPRGPRSFVWADDPAADAKRLDEAIKEVRGKVTIQEGRVITIGFSQGAQTGLEVAVRNPEVYAGSIVMSPGADYHLDGFTAGPALAKRGFVVTVGGKEHPGNVQLAQMDATWLRKANAKVIHKPYPGVAAHSLPADFVQRFPEWVRFILDARGK